jgi:hypothetical protein
MLATNVRPARDYGLMSNSCAGLYCRLYKLPLAALSNAATDSARFGRTFGDPNTVFNNRDTTDYPPPKLSFTPETAVR